MRNPIEKFFKAQRAISNQFDVRDELSNYLIIDRTEIWWKWETQNIIRCGSVFYGETQCFDEAVCNNPRIVRTVGKHTLCLMESQEGKYFAVYSDSLMY